MERADLWNSSFVFDTGSRKRKERSEVYVCGHTQHLLRTIVSPVLLSLSLTGKPRNQAQGESWGCTARLQPVFPGLMAMSSWSVPVLTWLFDFETDPCPCYKQCLKTAPCKDISIIMISIPRCLFNVKKICSGGQLNTLRPQRAKQWSWSEF